MLMYRILACAFACVVLPALVHAAEQTPAPLPPAMQRAQALTQEQIESSRDLASLGRLKTLYARMGDKQHYRWTLAHMTEMLPGDLGLKMELATSYAADDMKTAAYDLLLRMPKQGFGLDIGEDKRFSKIHGTQAWDYIVKSLAANLEPFGDGKVAFTLPADDLLIHSIAWDPKHKQLLVGSAREGKIFRVGEDGKLQTFIAADEKMPLWSVFDMRVDPEHNRLWVATTSVAYFNGYDTDNAGKAALLQFDLESGELLHTYPLPGRGKFLSSLALAPDGRIFAADGVHNTIYELRDGKLVVFTSNPKLTQIHAMAVSGDGKNLYIADARLGIVGMQIDSKKAFMLGYNRAALVLPGISGMLWYDGTLVVIQPGMQPARVMRLHLSDDGRSVASAMPIDVAKPEFKALGMGTVAGDKLYFIANLQRDKYDSHGLLKDDVKLEPVQIYESNLRFAWGQNGIGTGLSEVPASKK